MDADSQVSIYVHPSDWPLDVRELAKRSQRENVQSSAPWYCNLIDTVIAKDGDSRFHVLRRNGRAVAAIPLKIDASLSASKVESLTNFYTCLYGPMLDPDVSADELVPLIRSIMRAYAPLASLKFAPMDPESASFRLLVAALRKADLRPYTFFCFGNWYLPVTEQWPTYLKAREGMLRSTLKRMGKRFAGESGTLEIIQGGDRLEAGLTGYQQVYAASWKNAEPYPEFMPGLIRTCAERGWLRLGVAWLGGKAIAAQVWIVANQRAEIYKLAYDEDFKIYSPGSLLTALLMQHVFEIDQVKEVDYLIGDDPYKKAWMTDRRERWGTIAYNPRVLKGRIAHWKEAGGRALKAAMGKTGPLPPRAEDEADGVDTCSRIGAPA